MWNKLVEWFWYKLRPRYKVTVSFNKEYGDEDDRSYITKKIIVQKEKHLKFRDDNGRIIEYQSAAGLNYIIEDC
tara:strand:+ start:235 stop:456 length:222 start_codon:yes stop_codon:yes gene_type:complete